MKKILIIFIILGGLCPLQSQDREPRNMRLTYLENGNYYLYNDSTMKQRDFIITTK